MSVETETECIRLSVSVETETECIRLLVSVETETVAHMAHTVGATWHVNHVNHVSQSQGGGQRIGGQGQVDRVLELDRRQVTSLSESLGESGVRQNEGLVREDAVEYLEKIINKWTGRQSVPEFNFKEITQQETVKLLLRLGSSSSFGHEGIDAQILKMILPSISGPLTHTINVSLRESSWVNRWKIARMFPLLKDKKLNKLDPASYRPVSLLPTISKVVERAAQVQLLDFFENTGQINPEGHAYRKAHSTTTTIVNIMDEIYQATDDKRISQLLTIDQSVAFDVLSHEILARKLRKYNVSAKAVKWVQNYLSFRSQYVTVNAANSQICQQTRGVPQGSVI